MAFFKLTTKKLMVYNVKYYADYPDCHINANNFGVEKI